MRGFTLLELLVALFVSAVMFSLGYGALNQAASQKEQLQTAQQSLAEVQRAVRFLSQDVMQMMPRPVRDELGRAIEPALLVDPRQNSLMTLSRGGQSISLGDPRGRLLRVRYLVQDGQLIRLSTPILDRTAASPPWRRRVLLEEVDGLEIRALDQSGVWQETWPQSIVLPQDAAAAEIAAIDRLRSRPRAIEFRLVTRKFGEIRRVIEVTG